MREFIWDLPNRIPRPGLRDVVTKSGEDHVSVAGGRDAWAACGSVESGPTDLLRVGILHGVLQGSHGSLVEAIRETGGELIEILEWSSAGEARFGGKALAVVRSWRTVSVGRAAFDAGGTLLVFRAEVAVPVEFGSG